MEENIIKDQKIRQFFTVYASNFGRISSADGAEEYQKWLQSPRVDVDIVIEIVKDLGRSYEGNKKPLLPKLQSIYYKIIKPKKITKTFQPCNLCKNSGISYILIGISEGKTYVLSKKTTKKYDSYEIKKQFCRCNHGFIRNIDAGLISSNNDEEWEKLKKYCDNMKKHFNSLMSLEDCKKIKQKLEG